MDNQNFYEQKDPDQNTNGQNPYGQNPYEQNPYEQNPYGSQNPYGTQDPYRQNPYGQNPYGQNPYGQNPYPGSPWQNQPQNPGPNGLAITSFVLGLLSLCTCWCLYSAFPFGAVGIILAILSRKGRKMHGLAVAGLVLSIVGILLAALYILIMVNFLNSPEGIRLFEEIYDSYSYY